MNTSQTGHPTRKGERTSRFQLAEMIAGQRLETLARPPLYAVNEHAPFHKNYAISVPASSGCYVISDVRGPLYVGRTGSLRQRFLEHLTRSHNELLTTALENPWGQVTFGWILHRPEGLNEAETWLIGALQPLCNRNISLSTVDSTSTRHR